MTDEEAKEVTEIVKEKLKENGDIYSEHILAYVSYLETQIEKMKNCRFAYDNKHDCMPCEDMEDWEIIMTEEELFKVYIKRELCVHCGFPQCCKNCSDIATAKRHYLAGVEAGKSLAETDLAIVAYMQGAERYKPKWHNLQKNPKDLPEPHSTVLDENGDKITYRGGDMWTVYSEYYEKDIDAEQPKAWCEVPTFTDKE